MKRDLFRAMGTTIDVTAATDDAIAETRRIFETVEETCSRFLPESELSRSTTLRVRGVALSD